MTMIPFKSAGPLPDVEIDTDAPSIVAVTAAAAQFLRHDIVARMSLTAVSEYGEVPVPVVCTHEGQDWAPYIETEGWSPDAMTRFVTWLAVLRTTSYRDVGVQVYSREPIPPLLAAVLDSAPVALFQLQGFLLHRAFAFSENAKLFSSLSARWLQTPLDLRPEALGALESVIVRAFGQATPLAVLGSTVHLVGCYLGETLRACFGGDWQRVTHPGFQAGWALSLPTANLNPLGKAEKRFTNGATDSLWLFYLTVKKAIGR